MLALFAISGTAIAADTLELKKGVKFNHATHQSTLGDCMKCHDKMGKIEGFGREFAHDKANPKGCQGCHTEMKKGPVSPCNACHKE